MATTKNQTALDGFPYGLNTSIDESILNPRYSPFMVNMMVSDTNSLVRRNGFTEIKNLSATYAVNGMCRLYKNDGSKHMLYVCGTHVYKQAISATPYSDKTIQILTTEPIVTAATYAYNIVVNNYSGGGALCATDGTVKLTIPACTNLKIRTRTAASYRHNSSGAFSNLASPSLLSLTASRSGTNVVEFRSTACNTTSIKVVPTGGVTNIIKKTAVIPAGTTRVSIWFYDDATQTAYGNYAMASIGSSMVGTGAAGVYTNTSSTNYVYMAAVPTVSGITRTTGWHKIEFAQQGSNYATYFDGVGWGLTAGTLGGSYLHFHTATGTYYWDRIEYDYQVVDDMDTTDTFTLVNGGGHSISSTRYVNIPRNLILDYATYTLNYSTTPTIIDSVSASARWFSFVNIVDRVYYGSDYDQIRSFDGSSDYSVTNATRAGFMVENKNRMFSSGNSSAKTLVNFTAAGLPESWTSASGGGVVNLVASGGQDHCTGLTVWDEKVIYFSYSRSSYLNIVDAMDSDNSGTLSYTNGCIAPKSLVTGAKGAVFLSADGVRGYGPLQQTYSNDGTGFSHLSRNIYGLNKIRTVATTYEEYGPLVGYSLAHREAAVGAYYDNKYWLFIGGDCFVGDLLKTTDNGQPVWTYHEYDIGIVTSAYVTRGDEYGLYVGTDGGSVYKLDTNFHDDDSPIHWRYDTPLYPIGGYANQKHFKNTHIGVALNPRYSSYMKNITATFHMYAGTENPDHSYGTQDVTASLSTDIKPIRVPMSSSGRALKIRVSGTNLGEPIEIPYMIINYGNPRAR